MLQGIEELRSGRGGGAGVGLNDIPARDHIASGELFENYARQKTHVHGVDLNQVARLAHRVLLGFAHRVGTGTQRPPRSGRTGARRFHQPTLPLEVDENAPQHRSGDRDLLAAEQHGQLIFAPARKLQTQSQDPFLLREKTKSAAAADADGGSGLPASSD